MQKVQDGNNQTALEKTGDENNKEGTKLKKHLEG